jgi:tetratricopeptide (TPR) repeat protein
VPHIATTSSYSVVSEWEKSNASKIGRGSYPRQVSGSFSGVGSDTVHSKHSKNKATDESVEAAEKHKSLGNTQMANREYEKALESYSTALELSPNGPQSHVYYSNRAAALCYLERYDEAVQDSELAIYLKPGYGKAHARLGLSKYFLNDLEGSIAAYKVALKYDPENAASKSYLAKAQSKLENEGKLKFNVSDEARRLMADPDMMHVAKKMMRGDKGVNDSDLLEDPEMKNFARKAMSDPVMFEAFQTIQRVSPKNL